MSRIDDGADENETTEVRIVTVALLSVSRERAIDDPSMAFLAAKLHGMGHQVIKRLALAPAREAVEAQLRAWVAEESVDVIVVTGGVGVLPDDVVPEAVRAVVERELPGFGEAVRAARSEHVGLLAVHGREVAGVAGGSFVLAVGGDPSACAQAWDAVLEPLLDPRSEASLVPLLSRLVAT